MLTHVAWVCLGPAPVVYHDRVVVAVRQRMGSFPLTADRPFEALEAWLLELKKKAKDVRVYLVVPGGLHFAYDLPRLADPAELGAAVLLRLKKDLLFAPRELCHAHAAWPVEGGARVTVTGVRRAELKEPIAAVARAGLAVQRVYFQDQIMAAALWAQPSLPATTTLVVDEGGVLVMHRDGRGPQIWRPPSRSPVLSPLARLLDGAPADAAAKRAADEGLLAELAGAGLSGFQPVETALPGLRWRLKAALEDPGSVALGTAGPRERLMAALGRGSGAPAGAPFARAAEEEDLGYRPTREHLAAAAVALLLLWSGVSTWLAGAALEERAELVARDAAAVESAKRLITSCDAKTKGLDTVARTLDLFSGEGYDELGLVGQVAGALPAGTSLTSYRPDREQVRLQAVAPGRPDVLEFVARLERCPSVMSVRLGSMTFRGDGTVLFGLELRRDG